MLKHPSFALAVVAVVTFTGACATTRTGPHPSLMNPSNPDQVYIWVIKVQMCAHGVGCFIAAGPEEPGWGGGGGITREEDALVLARYFGVQCPEELTGKRFMSAYRNPDYGDQEIRRLIAEARALE